MHRFKKLIRIGTLFFAILANFIVWAQGSVTQSSTPNSAFSTSGRPIITANDINNCSPGTYDVFERATPTSIEPMTWEISGVVENSCNVKLKGTSPGRNSGQIRTKDKPYEMICLFPPNALNFMAKYMTNVQEVAKNIVDASTAQRNTMLQTVEYSRYIKTLRENCKSIS